MWYFLAGESISVLLGIHICWTDDLLLGAPPFGGALITDDLNSLSESPPRPLGPFAIGPGYSVGKYDTPSELDATELSVSAVLICSHAKFVQ